MQLLVFSFVLEAVVYVVGTFVKRSLAFFRSGLECSLIFCVF